MPPKKPIRYGEHDPLPDFPEDASVASANECTGLMYRVPMDDPELEAYEELYGMEIPKGEQDVWRGSVQANLHRAHTAEETGRAVKKAAGDAAEPHKGDIDGTP